MPVSWCGASDVSWDTVLIFETQIRLPKGGVSSCIAAILSHVFCPYPF